MKNTLSDLNNILFEQLEYKDQAQQYVLGSLKARIREIRGNADGHMDESITR